MYTEYHKFKKNSNKNIYIKYIRTVASVEEDRSEE